jgi:formylglycine-generating enzyme required for sulfatase activity
MTLIKEYAMDKRIILPVMRLCTVMILSAVTYGSPAKANLPDELTLDLGNHIQMQAVLIPAGTFRMGFQARDETHFVTDLPGRKVTISKSFYMGKYPVTQQQWQALMPTNPSRFSDRPRNPVDGVSWEDADEFCKKLTAKTSRPVRLPTEAEWEYACRAGTDTAFFFGNDPNALTDYAWVEANSNNTTHPVGQKKPNAWGLYDMCGNVWQWCSDWYDRIDNTNAPLTDPQGPAKSPLAAHVLRGGAWHTVSTYSHSAMRGGNFPCGEGGPASWDNASCSGFRIAVLAPISTE